MRCSIRLAVLFLAASCTTSCAGLADLPASLAGQQADGIASVSVTAFNVVPWPEIRDAYGHIQLQISKEDLLKMVFTTTAATAEVSKDSFALSLTGHTGLGSTATAANPAPATTGTPATLQAADLDADGERKLRLLTALEEQIVTLNHRLMGMPVQPGYKAFLVSLLVSVQPLSRQLPYDTTLKIGFAANVFQSGIAYDNDAPPIYTMPILATDFQEATNQSVSSDFRTDLGLTGAASQGMAGASGNLASTTERSRNSRALRPNSLFTVGNDDSGHVLLRLGANRIGDKYEMIPQVHELPVVILVDDRLLAVNDSCIRTDNVEAQTKLRFTEKELLVNEEIERYAKRKV